LCKFGCNKVFDVLKLRLPIKGDTDPLAEVDERIGRVVERDGAVLENELVCQLLFQVLWNGGGLAKEMLRAVFLLGDTSYCSFLCADGHVGPFGEQFKFLKLTMHLGNG
jgi:hypothetical protein